jgi:release factor glutamine methyltransferase
MGRTDKKVPGRAGTVVVLRTRASSRERSVYPEREDSELLRSIVRVRPQEIAVEVCCGRGLAALAAARRGARVVATDQNPHALRIVVTRAESEGLPLAAVRTDLLAGLRKFDVVWANPPYLPTPIGEEDPEPWDRLALDGGPDGLAITRRILDTLPEHLLPGGRAFVLFSSVQDPRRTRELLADWVSEGGGYRTVAQRVLGDGETLSIIRFERREPTRAARRRRGSGRRTGPHRRAHPATRPTASSRDGAHGRTPARNAASARTRSPRGS